MNDMNYITTINKEKLNYNHDIDLLVHYDLSCSRYNFGAGSTFNYNNDDKCTVMILGYTIHISPCKKQVGNNQYTIDISKGGASSRTQYKLVVRSKNHAEIIARKYLVREFNQIANELQISMRTK